MPKLEQITKLKDLDTFLSDSNENEDVTTVDNEENLNIEDKLDTYLRS